MFSIDSEFLIVSNGAAEIINVLRGVLKGSIGVPVPTFNEYIRCFPDNRIVRISTADNGYKFSVEAILERLNSVDNLILINPDNPTGSFLSRDEAIRIIDSAYRQKKRVVFDESFIDFADNDKRYTLFNEDILKKYDNLIIVKSISKSYGVPGLRLGVAASADREALAVLKAALPVWNINSFAEYFLQTITLFQRNYYAACDRIVCEREFLFNGLKKLGFEVFPSQANFIMAKIKTNGTLLAAELLEKHDILIKDLYGKETFDSTGYLRFAIRDRKDNEKLIFVMEQVLKAVM
jgi:histidinol-phosphate/aromatic aminotransferase/cobyric acid decarboxylase-like protein